LSIKVQYGFVQDFYSIDMPNKKFFITGWEKFRQGNGFDGDTYKNIEAAYTWQRNKVGIRYRRNGLAYEQCYISNGTNECFQQIIETPINISAIYFRNLLSPNASFDVNLGLGFGTKQLYDMIYLDNNTKLLAIWEHTIRYNSTEKWKFDTKEYIDESTYFLPIELSIGYKFNKFVHFSLNAGYNYQLDKYSAKTDIEYYFVNNPNDKKPLTIYTSNEGYIGLGISIHFDIKKLKNKADEVKN
jgi:hypothetical protein